VTRSLSLDFQEALDRISHQFLFTKLQSYGLSDWFVDRVKSMYENTVSSVQINGHIAGPIPIRCSIRQGCPMSIVRFALCINPFLKLLEKSLAGVRLGRSGRCTVVVTYADVTIFVTNTGDFRVVRDAVRLYEEASGACLNVRKSKALAAVGSKRTANDLGVNFHSTIKILGITFSSTIGREMHESWAQLSGRVKAQAQHAYGRYLCLEQRV
jgi:hypothetical protein